MKDINTLVCIVDMFSLNNSIFLNDKKIESCSTYELGEVLATLCNRKKINHVHLFGDINFLEPIINDIHTTASVKFNKNNSIIVEVN